MKLPVCLGVSRYFQSACIKQYDEQREIIRIKTLIILHSVVVHTVKSLMLQHCNYILQLQACVVIIPSFKINLL